MENKICQHEKYEIISEAREVKIGKCRRCNLVFAAKKNYAEPNKIYRNYYVKETGSRFGRKTEYIVKIFRLLRAVKIFFLKPDARSILDIGSGRGWMLYFLKKYFKYTIQKPTIIGLA